MGIKAYGYVRVSGAGQVEGHGLKRQEGSIMRYAQAHSIEVLHVFKELGVSGTLEDRPALTQLMLALKKNRHEVKAVVVERLDRLARDLLVQEILVRDLAKQGFQLISSVEGDDLSGDDATRILVRQVLGAIAQYDKSMLTAKLRAARERKKAQEGKCEGRKAYGETEQEQHVLRRIRAMRRKKGGRASMTWQAIADRLNDEGVRAKAGGFWTPSKLHSVMLVRSST